MEEDPVDLKSKILKRYGVQKQLEKLIAAAENANDIIQYESAHNPEIQYAIGIIENFLMKRKRVCYGGTAINALLPKALKFYDVETSLPDYDFFTPTPEKDIQEIVAELQKAGFQEVVQKVGIHEGTFKILVNFTPLADITEQDPFLYKVIFDRSVEKNGIHYCDPDILRMLMYLELSRPRGQVDRWEKVFERLTLLNTAFPVRQCKASTEQLVGRVHIPMIVRNTILNYVLDKNRILVGADVVALYDWMLKKSYQKKPSIQWFLRKNGMMIFMSPEAIKDAFELKQMLGSESIEIQTLRGNRDIVPERVIVSFRGYPFAIIVQEVACHSYNEIPLRSGRKLRVGTLETLLTLYYTMTFFTQDESIMQFLLFCLCNRLIEMRERLARLGDRAPVPLFSIECSGYQKGYATLLKEKFLRIIKEKKKRSTRNLAKARTAKTRKNHDV